MLKKTLYIFFLISVLIFPIKTEASPGCCSWHGGEAGCSGGKTVCSDGWVSSCGCDGSSSSSVSGNSSIQKYNELQERWEKIEAFFWITLIVGFIVLGIYGNISEEKKKKEKQKKEIEEIRKKQLEEKKAQMKKIGTKYSSETNFVNKINKEIESNNLSENIIDDGYLHNIEPNELFNKIKLNNTPETYSIYKRIIDKLVEKNKGAKYYFHLAVSILDKNELNIKFFKYLINKNVITDEFRDCYIGKLVEKAFILNNMNAIEILMQCNVKKGFDYNNLKILCQNNSDELLKNIINNENVTILTNTFILNDIYENRYLEIFEFYLNNHYLTSYDLDKIFKQLIELNDNSFMDLILKKYSYKNDNDSYIISSDLNQNNLMEAYKNKNISLIKKMIDYGFNKNLFSRLEEQEKFEKYLQNENDWFEVKEDNDLSSKTLASFIRNNLYEDFVNKYELLNHSDIKTNGETLLFLAIRYNRVKFVEFMLKNNCNTERIKSGFETNGLSPLLYAIYKKRYKIVEVFIENGSNINYPDENGFTPLDYASMGVRDLKLSKILLEKGAKSFSNQIYDKIVEAINYKDMWLAPFQYIPIIVALEKKKKNDK